MKKLGFIILILMLAALLVCSLVACGETRDNDGGATKTQQEGGKDTQPGTPSQSGEGEASFSDVVSGEGTTTQISSMSAEEKQAFVAAAAEQGYSVEFGTDGSTTMTGSDGSTFHQNPDGTWEYRDADGNMSQLGGTWPDNEYTRQIPKPSFPLLGASLDDEGFTVGFSDITIEDVRAYAEQVKARGFTIDAELEDEVVVGIAAFNYSAGNADGYRVEISFANGYSGITVTKQN